MKENRIYCTEVRGECQHLMDTTSPLSAYLCECTPGFYCNKDIAWKPITKDACKNCKEGRYQGFTREQAIEKMAKAIFTQIWGLPNNRFDLAKSSVKVRNRKLAEAALNALLERNDNEK